jgi:uncharacterized protein (DUF305 family)
VTTGVVGDVGDPESPDAADDPESPDDAGAADENDETVASQGPPPPAGLSWPRVVVLGMALAFLGFALGVFVTQDRAPGSGSVDVGFYQDMITHHDQALQMASLALDRVEDPTVSGYAQEVLAFQEYEIGVMERTLHEWGYTRADRSEEAMAWMGMPVPVEQMDGLISEEQMTALRQARGPEAEALFLDLMAEHHAGGIHMASYAAEEASDHDVRELASRMARNQSVEINEYAQTAERLDLPVEIPRVPVPDAVEESH